MSKKTIRIITEGTIIVEPGAIFYGKIVPSGNGAVISARKKYIGQSAVVILLEKVKKGIRQEEAEEERKKVVNV